jgi:pumilio family protein 6
MSPQLLSAVPAAASTLVQNSFGCQLIADILFSAVGDKTAGLKAVAKTAAGDPSSLLPDKSIQEHPHVSKTPHGGRLFKTLIAGGRYDKATGQVNQVDPPLKFADHLYPVIKDFIVDWATGPSSFVVVNLLESNDFSSGDDLRKTLRSNRTKLEKAATENIIDDMPGEIVEKGRKKAAGSRPPGNMGSRILLDKLA